MTIGRDRARTQTTTASRNGITDEASAGEAVSFVEKYEFASAANDSILCIGLDPDHAEMPDGVPKADFLLRIVDATRDLVCAYKPNSPFFEAEGARGFAELKTVIDEIHRSAPRVPVILDSKRADIPNTSKFFADSVFRHFRADATVVNPYMGFDALEPFVEHEGQHTFVLCRTSNPGARDFQDLLVGDARRPLYLEVADQVQKWGRPNVGLVVGATYPADASRIREVCPERLLLVPGIGKQEGELEKILQATGDNSIVNSSRSILYAGRFKSDYRTRFAEYARIAAETLRDQLNQARNTTVRREGAAA